MKIIDASFEVMSPIDGDEILKHIERCGRVCYKSEDRITENSAKTFVANIIKRGHEAVLEHASITVKFIVDRGVSHEIVRHRIASYCQESTRYCNYSGEGMTVISPCFWGDNTDQKMTWAKSMIKAENAYIDLIEHGASPQEARAVLPNSLKTEVVMTANLREWRHFLKQRTAKAAHPQIREVAIPLLKYFQEHIPVIFDDIEV